MLNIKKEQQELFVKIKNIKRKYTKCNLDRRTDQQISLLKIELNSLWEHFVQNEKYITTNGEVTEFFEEAENCFFTTIEFFDCELNDFCMSNTDNNINNISIEENLELVVNSFNKQVVDINTVSELDSKNSLEQTEKLNIMACTNIKEIVTTVNKCIPIFKGEEGLMLSAEISNFVACCEVVLSMFDKQGDKEYFFSIIKTRLQGHAFEVVSQSEIKTVKDLEIILKDNFMPKLRYTDIKAEIIQIKQHSNESIFKYGQRISKLLVKSIQSIKEKYVNSPAVVISLSAEEEILTIRSFRKGLINTQINLRLSCCDLTKLKLAIEKAIHMESEEKEIEPHSTKLFPKQLGNIRCSFCNKLGLQVEQCWHALQASNSSQAGPSNSKTYENHLTNNIPKSSLHNQVFKQLLPQQNKNVEFTCYECGRKGHTARSCRFKIFNQGQVRTVCNSDNFEFCQFCKVANHSTINCTHFSSCLKSVLSQTSGNATGPSDDTTAGAHKTH